MRFGNVVCALCNEPLRRDGSYRSGWAHPTPALHGAAPLRECAECGWTGAPGSHDPDAFCAERMRELAQRAAGQGESDDRRSFTFTADWQPSPVVLVEWPEYGCWAEQGFHPDGEELGYLVAPMHLDGSLPTENEVGECEVRYSEA